MKLAALLSLPLLTCSLPTAHAFGRRTPYQAPCPRIHILRAEGSIDLTDTETRLICGDPEADRVGKSWKDVPISQAKQNFRNFLQDRGYFEPTFKEHEGGIIDFDPGPRSHVQSITAPEAPPTVEISKYRFARGQPMTPKRVSEVRDWYRKRLMEEGYPCPELEGRGDPDTGEVQVRWLNPAPVAVISAVNEDGSLGLAPGTLRRYDALSVGQPFSLIRSEISGRRATGARLVLADDLEPMCPLTAPAQVAIKETAQVGPPRLVSFAVGANTESLVLGKASWSHTRLGRAGSNVDFTARGSFKEQSARARGDWYLLGGSSTQRLSPFIQLAHENEQRYELIGVRSAAIWRTSAETIHGMLTVGGGMGWRNLRQLQGIGPDHFQFPTFQAEAGFVTHDFEYYASSPRNGGRASVTATLAGDEVRGAGHPLQLKLDSTWLSNPGGFDPPWVVLGARATASATFLPSTTLTSDLPVDFRQWVGGGNDIRGYGRLELPNDDFGGRYTVTLGTEVRFPYTLPFKIEPFLLADFGIMRSGPAADSESTLGVWSPGFGLRCESPIGPIRASVAHGYVLNGVGPEHWQFYLGLGEEF